MYASRAFDADPSSAEFLNMSLAMARMRDTEKVPRPPPSSWPSSHGSVARSASTWWLPEEVVTSARLATSKACETGVLKESSASPALSSLASRRRMLRYIDTPAVIAMDIDVYPNLKPSSW